MLLFPLALGALLAWGPAVPSWASLCGCSVPRGSAAALGLSLLLPPVLVQPLTLGHAPMSLISSGSPSPCAGSNRVPQTCGLAPSHPAISMSPFWHFRVTMERSLHRQPLPLSARCHAGSPGSEHRTSAQVFWPSSQRSSLTLSSRHALHPLLAVIVAKYKVSWGGHGKFEVRPPASPAPFL